MTAVDTSVAVAAFGEWHQRHEDAVAVLDAGAVLPTHALLETYAVLTSLPPPHRVDPQLVQAWLEDRFTTLLDPPPPHTCRELIGTLVDDHRPGGAVYDALVALTAKLAGFPLTTADSRADAVYQLVGVDRIWLTDAGPPHE